MPRDPFEIKQDTVTEMRSHFSPSEWDRFLAMGSVFLNDEYPVLAGYINELLADVNTDTPHDSGAAVLRGIMSVLSLIKFQSDKSAAEPRIHMGALSPFDD